MEKKTLKQRIKENSGLKQAVHRFIMHPVKRVLTGGYVSSVTYILNEVKAP